MKTKYNSVTEFLKDYPYMAIGNRVRQTSWLFGDEPEEVIVENILIYYDEEIVIKHCHKNNSRGSQSFFVAEYPEKVCFKRMSSDLIVVGEEEYR